MAFDFRKEYKEFYMPKNKPELVDVPAMNFIAVRGSGNPNEEDGEFQRAMDVLYPLAYTIKMSYKGEHKIDGFFEYVVPPLEGFWWMENIAGVDYAHKSAFHWIALIRLPDFVKREDFDWAVAEATRKKKGDFSSAEFFSYHEGLCVQCMHHGAFDDEPATVAAMEAYAHENGYVIDINEKRYHHEIYMTDSRKCPPKDAKTVIRHPVKKV